MVIEKQVNMNTDFYKSLELPLIAAPMFLISGPELVIECCKNGIVGTFPALNQRTSEGFEEWVIQIKGSLESFEEETGKKATKKQSKGKETIKKGKEKVTKKAKQRQI